MSYAYADGVVWISELTAVGHPMEHDMCAQHADSVRVPRGWTLHDERVATPHHVEPESRRDLIGA